MRKKKKILKISIIIALICVALVVSNTKKVEEILSENASQEKFQINNEENGHKYVRNEDLATDKVSIHEANENTEECIYEEGKALIIYESDNFFTNLKVKTISLFNKYEIEDIVKFEEANREDSSDISVATVCSDEYSTEELVQKLNEKKWVISAIPNYEFKTTGLTNDEFADIQWALQNDGQFAGENGNDTNPITTTSEKEKVIAIVDTGVDYTNADLVNVMWENSFDQNTLPGRHGYDFVNNDNQPMDDFGHGTHCAGIVAAEANNGIGISGATLGVSNVKIMALKVGDANGNINLNNVVKAYNYIFQAQALGVNIVAINNSWGAVFDSESNGIQEVIDLFDQIIEQAGKNGAISVFAAGNNGLDLNESGVYNNGNKNYIAFPACLENDYEITVAATDVNDELGYFSNYGDAVDIAAPGVDIYSTYKSGKVFNPTSSEKEEYCLYEDFEGDSSEVIDNITPYVLVNEQNSWVLKDCSSICSIEVDDEKFYGESGKALKILVDNSKSNNREVWLRFPLGELEIPNFDAYAISLDLHVVQDTNGTGTKPSNYGYVYNGSCLAYLENKTGSSYYRFGATNICETDYWHHWNAVYIQKNYAPLEYFDIVISNPGRGEYTVYIDNLTITKDLGDDYMRVLTPYELQSGTSMAAPHVTASVAVASNQYENYNAKEIKNLIINGTRDEEKFEGLIRYGALDMQSFLKPQEIGLVYGDSYYNFDGKEHSINLKVEKPTSGIEIYYSTEHELTTENYLSGTIEKPTFVNPGEYTVYWYVHSTDGQYTDKFGKSKLLIDKKIEIKGSSYSGKYDTEEHTIGLYSEVQTNEIQMYFSTEQELNFQNYNIAGNTIKPSFTNVGEYVVYWYAHSINGILEDVSGKNEVSITPAMLGTDLDNEYALRKLTGSMANWNLVTFKLNNKSYTYSGTQINPIGKLMFRGKEMKEGIDYTVEYYLSNYDNNNEPKYDSPAEPIEANKIYLAKITGIGNFWGRLATEDFSINLRNITITANDQKILEGNQIKTGIDEITVSEDGLAEKQVISEITIERAVGGNNQDSIKASNAIIKDNSNNDVTSNYNITYVDGNLTIYTVEEIVEVQFNDNSLYKSIILGNNIETIYEDEETLKAIFDKNIIEQTQAISLSDNYGKITDLTGLSSFYNLKRLYMQNVDITNVTEIEKILELSSITEVKVNSSCRIEEMQTDVDKMFLPPFLQLTAQTQNNATITAHIHYGENNKSEISVNKDENGKLYIILDNEVSTNKPAGNRIVEFKVSGGVTNGSSYSVLYNVEPPLTNFEAIKVGEEECIVLPIQRNNSAKNILTRANFPNTNYEVNAIGANGNTLMGDDLLATGTKIELKSENQTKIFTLIIRGDVNCDGIANLKDLLVVNKHRLNKGQLKDIFLIAGDVNNDGNADFKDILKINKFRLGK